MSLLFTPAFSFMTGTGSSFPVTDQLALHLDATDTDSYSGSGTTWTDLSGNGYNFTLSNASAFVAASGSTPAHMNFESQICRRLVSGSLSDVPNATNGTIVIFSTIKNITNNWRTLTRGSPSEPDHQVIIENGSNDLGMYDNQGGAFQDSGFNINSVPSYTTAFNMHAWKLSQSSPYYQYFYNTNTSTASGTITNANATFNNGFSAIGGYHSEIATATNSGSQHWGKIMTFLYYQKHLSSSELDQIYNYYKDTANL